VRAHEELGRLDVLVNNAGILRDNRVEQISDEDWHAVLDVHLTGAFHGIRAALPLMKEQRYGRILSFSSMSWRGNFGQANYVAAKAGIVGLTRGVALEAARHGITVNAIAPGLIEARVEPRAAARDRAHGRDQLLRGCILDGERQRRERHARHERPRREHRDRDRRERDLGRGLSRRISPARDHR
jgi:NAD(P)-dependent dehydrogenase (short-subunit alcohol dehydrogenase family)